MKKTLLIIALALLTSTLLAQKKSNYEIYWQAREDSITKSQMTLSRDTTEKLISSAKSEYDDLYYQPNKDAKKVKHVKKDNVDILIDTIIKENPNISINYYDIDPFFYSYNIGRFYHGGFNYWMYGNPWYYSNYWMFDTYDWYWYNPWYHNSFYFGYNNWWYGYNNWWHRPYYIHNDYNRYNNFYGYNKQPKQNIQYGRRETYSTLTNNQPNNRRVLPVQQSQEKRTVSPQNKATYQESRRTTNTPSYTQPRMNTRPDYNNSKSISTMPQRRIETSTQSRTQTSTPNVQRSTQSRTQSGSYSQPSIQRRVETSTQSRTYSVPTRSSSSNYSQPSRSYSQPSNNYNSGSSVSRSSSGSNFSNTSNSGSSNSSGSGGESRTSTGSSGTSSTRR
jgi:hypothetical protein